MRDLPALPSPLALRAFESVARLGSASRAAEELLITQSAVSHHLRRLEQDLGVMLFVRRARGMDLTEVGRDYFETVRAAFGLIAEGTAKARAHGAGTILHVSLLPSFAAHWLAPRLGRLREAHPDIDLRLDPTKARADFAQGGIDLALRYGDGSWPGMTADLIMRERLTPVMAPVVAPAGVTALTAQPLLITREAFDWRLWGRETGFDLAARAHVQLTDYNIVLQAALNGEGLAMGRLRLIGDFLTSGDLMAPFDRVVESEQVAYWVVRPEGRKLSSAAERFIAWLVAEAALQDTLAENQARTCQA